jgi:hypothetical protein
MEQSRNANYAAAMDARIKLSEEECAEGMGQKLNNAVS